MFSFNTCQTAFIYLAMLLLIFSCKTPGNISQEAVPVVDTAIVMFYNVENFFDTINQQGTRDGEFTPQGKNEWNTERYQKKLTDLSRVILAVDSPGYPLFVGLCEVENNYVLKDLAQHLNNQGSAFGIVHYESPDRRGIDVALFYDTTRARILSSRPLEVHFKDAPNNRTRDILYAKAVVKKADTIHLFVNHWPSRAGGQEASEPKRIQAALTLREVVDSLLMANPIANLLIMGDFNDEPMDTSLRALGAGGCGKDTVSLLCNLMLPLKEKGLGTYNYRNNWNMLDHIIVSPGLLRTTGKMFVNFSTGAGIFAPEWLQYVDEKSGAGRPNRTYVGPKYVGGISDHYPVYMYLYIKK